MHKAEHQNWGGDFFGGNICLKSYIIIDKGQKYQFKKSKKTLTDDFPCQVKKNATMQILLFVALLPILTYLIPSQH